MGELEVVSILNGQFAENCYLLADPASRGAVLIDPGEEAGRFLAELGRRRLHLEAIWLTHAHVDHIIGVGAVKQATGAPVFLHPADRPLYDGLPRQGEWMGFVVPPAPPPDHPLADGDTLRLGAHRFTVRHTPGHSPGSVCFLTSGRVFAGDVLFAGSIGRTDLPGGDHQVLLHSIASVLLPLPDSTIVHSGHGPETTVGVERETNPFLAGASRLA